MRAGLFKLSIELASLALAGLVVAACSQSNSPRPAASPSRTIAATPEGGTARLATAPLASCAPGASGWRQLYDLRQFPVFGGYASADGCRVILAGQQVSPSQAGVILRSADGGRSFAVAQSFPQATVLRVLAFSDEHTGWVAGDTADGTGLVLRSEDVGETWQAVQLPSLQAPVEISAITSSGGVVWLAGRAGCRAFLIATSDAGASWRAPLELRPAGGTCVGFPVVVGSLRTTVMAAGNDGAQGFIVVSGDAGQTFQRASLAPNLLSGAAGIAILDPHSAYVGGSYQTNPAITEARAPVLLHSTDGGVRWAKVSVPAELFVGDLKFVSKQRGYAVTNAGLHAAGAVLMTDDAGLTWQSSTLPTTMGEVGIGPLFLASNGTVYVVAGGTLFARPP